MAKEPKEPKQPKIRNLADFGIVTDIDVDLMEKWDIGNEHIITGVVMLNGEYGDYPGFVTENGMTYIVGGVVVNKTAEQLREVFSQFPGIGFKLRLEEKESKQGRNYNVLVEVPKE